MITLRRMTTAARNGPRWATGACPTTPATGATRSSLTEPACLTPGRGARRRTVTKVRNVHSCVTWASWNARSSVIFDHYPSKVESTRRPRPPRAPSSSTSAAATPTSQTPPRLTLSLEGGARGVRTGPGQTPSDAGMCPPIIQKRLFSSMNSACSNRARNLRHRNVERETPSEWSPLCRMEMKSPLAPSTMYVELSKCGGCEICESQ